jgi:alkylation response protein AidB-like acyl-CoA dehydrogenase
MHSVFPQPWPTAPAHCISCDAEALDAAHRLAEVLRAGARDQIRRLPMADINAFSASGLGAITVPQAYGGPDVSNVTLAEVIAIISAADASLGQMSQNQLVFYRMLGYLPDVRVKNWVFARALAGLRFGSTLSEAHNGTATGGGAVRIRQHGNGYIVSGRTGCSNAVRFAHYLTLHALNEQRHSVRALIPNTASGLEVNDDSATDDGTPDGTIVLHDVRLGGTQVFDTEALFDRPTLCGPTAQLIQAAIDAGIAREALRETIAFIRERSRPWIDSGAERASEDPCSITEVGEVAAKVQAADAMLHRAAEVLDECAGHETSATVTASSMAVAEAKALTAEASVSATSKLFELTGTHATIGEYMLERHRRHARTAARHDPVRWTYQAAGERTWSPAAVPRQAWI